MSLSSFLTVETVCLMDEKVVSFEAYVYIQQKEFLKIYIFLDKNADGLFLLTIVQRYFHFALNPQFY